MSLAHIGAVDTTLASHQGGRMSPVRASELVMNGDIWRRCRRNGVLRIAIIRDKNTGAQSVSDRLLGRTTFHLAGMNRGGEVVLGKRFSPVQLLHSTAHPKESGPSGWPLIPIGHRRRFRWRNVRPARKGR
jgi:hypothetical protein